MRKSQSLLQPVKESQKGSLNNITKGLSLCSPAPGTADKDSARPLLREMKLSTCLNPTDFEIMAYFLIRTQQGENGSKIQ